MEAIGFAASVLNIVGVITKSIQALRNLQLRWQAAELTVNFLVSQLTILQAALNQISTWTSSPQNHLFVMQVDGTLKCCGDLILLMDEHLSRLEWDEDGLTFQSKAKAVMNESNVKQWTHQLDSQSTALNLLLTIHTCQSLTEQKKLLTKKRSREIFDSVKDSSSSLVVLRDMASFSTRWTTSSTERSSLLSRIFDFDPEVQASRVYQGNVRSLIRRAIRGNSGRPWQSSSFPASKNIQSLTSQQPIAQYQSLPSSDGGVTGLPPGPATYPSISSTGNFEINKSVNQSSEFGILTLGTHPGDVGTFWERMGSDHEYSYLYDDLERRAWKGNILSEIVTNIQRFLNNTQNDSSPFSRRAVLRARVCPINYRIPLEVAQSIWHLSSEGWLEGANKYLDDYYLRSIGRFISKRYVPTDRDITRGLIKMYGEFRFILHQQRSIRFYSSQDRSDVCSKRLYQNTPIVVIIVDISSYDNYDMDGFWDRLGGDPGVSTWLVGSKDYELAPEPGTILLFNHVDILVEKLRISSAKFTSDYEGGPDLFRVVKEYVVSTAMRLYGDNKRLLYVDTMRAETEDNGELAGRLKEIISTELSRRSRTQDTPATSSSAHATVQPLSIHSLPLPLTSNWPIYSLERFPCAFEFPNAEDGNNPDLVAAKETLQFI